METKALDSVRINEALYKKYVGRLIETNIFNFRDDEPHEGEITSLVYDPKTEKIRIKCLLLEMSDSEDVPNKIVLSTPIELVANDRLIYHLLKDDNIWLDVQLKRVKSDGYFVALYAAQSSRIDIYYLAPGSLYDH